MKPTSAEARGRACGSRRWSSDRGRAVEDDLSNYRTRLYIYIYIYIFTYIRARMHKQTKHHPLFYTIKVNQFPSMLNQFVDFMRSWLSRKTNHPRKLKLWWRKQRGRPHGRQVRLSENDIGVFATAQFKGAYFSKGYTQFPHPFRSRWIPLISSDIVTSKVAGVDAVAHTHARRGQTMGWSWWFWVIFFWPGEVGRSFEHHQDNRCFTQIKTLNHVKSKIWLVV